MRWNGTFLYPRRQARLLGCVGNVWEGRKSGVFSSMIWFGCLIGIDWWFEAWLWLFLVWGILFPGVDGWVEGGF